jgi:hypothetical protein
MGDPNLPLRVTEIRGCEEHLTLGKKVRMKKTVRGEKGAKVRLSREAIRMLSGADLSSVAGGCGPSTCEMGPISQIFTKVRGVWG